jgi:hypothetical protein
MAVTRNLGVTHHVDGNVTAVKGIVNDVDGNVKAIKEVICDVTGHVEATKEVIQGVARIVDDNMKATKYGTKRFFIRSHAYSNPFLENSNGRA